MGDGSVAPALFDSGVASYSSGMSNTTLTQPDHLFTEAQTVLAGGVSASMRLHPYLGRPLYVDRGEGPYLYGVDGKRYIDFNMSNGAALLGHDHPAVKRAVLHGVELGIICAAETPFHERLAARMVEIIPAAERVRFSSVGSEVTLVALRIARHATGRTKYLKFDGHFHGLTEPWLYRRADPLDDASAVVPASGGVPLSGADEVVMVPWNDVEAFERAISAHGEELAAVFCEPIHYNAGCIPPELGFLELLRARCSEHGIVFVMDEVLSGFRTHLGGVQTQYGVTPDLTTHAKALANGLPLASVSGREDLMLNLAPTGPVAHSGTYSGHLLSVLAALATLEELSQPGVYDRVNATADAFYRDLQAIFDRAGVPARVQGMGARFGIYFGITDPVRTWSDALDHDHELNRRFATGCFERGVYFHGYTRQGPPGHAGFSLAHADTDFAETLAVVEAVTRDLRTA
jgi:glutamate-1-semialdehyde 2,1-aminomutase